MNYRPHKLLAGFTLAMVIGILFVVNHVGAPDYILAGCLIGLSMMGLLCSGVATFCTETDNHGNRDQRRERREAQARRLKRVYTEPQGTQVRVMITGGGDRYGREVGRFEHDAREALQNALAQAQSDADDYNERVHAAERISSTLNRAGR